MAGLEPARRRHRGRGDAVRLALAALAVAALGPAAGAASTTAGSWVGWDLGCETSGVPVAGGEWRWTWIEGLAAAAEDEARGSTARIEARASLFLLLRPGEAPRSLFLEARDERGGRSLGATLNGVELGAQRLGRKWRTLEWPIPPGTLVHGPNVVRFTIEERGARSGPGPVFLDRVAVEPAMRCDGALPVAVDPEVVNTLGPDIAVVVPTAWSREARLDLGLVAQWPATTLEVFCVDEEKVGLAETVTAGDSRRRALSIPLDGECAAGRALVLLGRGPGYVDVREARLAPLGRFPWRLILAAAPPAILALALAIVALAALGRRRTSERRAPGSQVLERLAAGAAKVLRSPFVWLLAVLWTVYFAALVGGALWAERVADTLGYENLLLEGSRDGVLAFSRTMGYPVFLYLSGWELWGIEKAAAAHALFFAAAIVVFWLGVRAYAGSGWLALCAALPLVFSPLVRIIRRIQPDFMGGAASVLAVALLVWLAAAPRRSRWLWAALAASIFAAYQIRPAVVFLIGFVPLAAVALWIARPGTGWPGLRRFTSAAVVAALGPFLLYGGVRWLTVGHFGLVSYGGFNVIGVTSPMLDDELVASLPAEHRELAAAILAEKRVYGLPTYTPGSPLEYWFDNYNRHVWSIAVPVARRLYEPDGPRQLGLIDMNERFTALSFAIIARRPGLYLDWIWRCLVRATGKALGEPSVYWPLLLAAAGGVVALARRRRGTLAASGSRLRPVLGLLAVALGYYAAHLLLIVAVEETLERYYVATVFLLPAALSALAFELWAAPLGDSIRRATGR